MSSTAAKKVCIFPILVAAWCVAVPALAGPPDTVAPVAALYRNFAWEALSSSSEVFGKDLASQSAPSLSRFFDARLVHLLTADTACQIRTRSVCKIDFDILFDSQDPRVVDLRIVAASANSVDVTFKDPVTEKETRITYSVARQSNGWRIADVLYAKNPQRSLRNVLSADIRQGVSTTTK